MQKLIFWLSLMGILFLAQACQPPKDLTIDQNQAEVAVPLFYSEMTIDKMLHGAGDSTAIKVYPNNHISLLYEGELVRRTATDILGEIPEQKIPLLVPAFDYPIPLLQGVQLSEAQIKSGFLHYHFTNETVNDIVTITFTIPQLLLGTVAFETQFDISNAGGLPAMYEDSIDLSGYDLDVAAGTLSLNYTAVDGAGNTVVLPVDTDWANPTKNYVYLSDVIFGYVEGHWDKVVQDFEEQTIEFDIFQNDYINGSVYFDDPQVDFTIISSFGLPVRTKVNFFRVVEQNGGTLDMESQVLTDGIDFNYPHLDEVGQTKETYFAFDKTNSNIDEILNTSPVRLEYDIDVTINPDNLPNSIGFATDSSYFSMSTRAELPLTGYVNNLVLAKEYAVDFSSFEAKEAVLKMVTDNEVPLDIRLQIYFLGANGDVLDSLVYDDSALVLEGADYPGPSSKHLENEFSLSPQRWAIIQPTKKIRIKSSYSTSPDGQQIVSFLSTQKTEIKVGLRLKL